MIQQDLFQSQECTEPTIDASQMCWMHLLPLGDCSCDVIHIQEMSDLG